MLVLSMRDAVLTVSPMSLYLNNTREKWRRGRIVPARNRVCVAEIHATALPRVLDADNPGGDGARVESDTDVDLLLLAPNLVSNTLA